MRDTTTDTDLRAHLDAHGTDGPIPDDAQPGWYALLTDDGYAWVGLLERAGLWLPGDPCEASPGEVTRHAPLRLANLTAERDAANALTTLVALTNLGPAATWRDVSEAVAEMLDKASRLRDLLLACARAMAAMGVPASGPIADAFDAADAATSEVPRG